MNKIFEWGVACGLLGMLQAAGPSRGQAPGNAGAPGMDPPAAAAAAPSSQTEPPTLETSRSFAPVPGAIPALIPVPVQIVPGNAEALSAELRSGFAGVIYPGPMTAGMLGAPGLETRTGGVGGAESARGPVSPYMAGGPLSIGTGPSAAGYFTSSPVYAGAYGVAETATNALEAPGAIPSQEVAGPTITSNGVDTTMTPGSMAMPARPPTSAGINTGFGSRAINSGFGTRAINTGFGSRAINAGFGTRSINLGFGTIPGTSYGTQGVPGPGSAGR